MIDADTKQAAQDAVDKTTKAAEKTVRHPLIKRLARFGFYTKAFLFAVIAFLAILVVIGSSGGRLTDATGALSTLGQTGLGRFALIAITAGAVGHGIWNILRGIADVDEAGSGFAGKVKRVVPVGIGLFYIGLAWTAFEILLSVRVSVANSRTEETLTAFALSIPLGFIFVFLIGVGVIAAGLHECYSGVTGKFQETYRRWEMSRVGLSVVTVLGLLSFSARALILVLIGWFFVMAAVAGDPNEAAGLDGALKALAQSTYGTILLLFTSAGLAAHSVLAVIEAKYRRIC